MGRPSATLVLVAGDPDLRDARPPSPPSAVIVRDGGAGLLVTWQHGSDDDVVRGYEVRRNGVHVGTSFSSAWSDREAQAMNAAYGIVAFDRAGNLSRVSAAASVSGTLPYGVGGAIDRPLIVGPRSARAAPGRWMRECSPLPATGNQVAPVRNEPDRRARRFGNVRRSGARSF